MVKKRHTPKYIPERGDIVWLSFSPTKGHEQSGGRPGLILTKKEFNEKVGLAIIAPISSTIHNYETEVLVKTAKTEGVVLVYQVKTVDWISRRAVKFDKVPTGVLEKVQNVLVSLILSQ